MTFPDYEAARVELARFNISDKDVDAAIHAALGDRVLYELEIQTKESTSCLVIPSTDGCVEVPLVAVQVWPKDALTEEDE